MNPSNDEPHNTLIALKIKFMHQNKIYLKLAIRIDFDNLFIFSINEFIKLKI